MEEAIDKIGDFVRISDVERGKKYFCPYCNELVVINSGLYKTPYFSHSPIKNRTPIQRSCPNYVEGKGYSKVEDELEIVYINNGGVPIYLTRVNSDFELRAYFPQLDYIYKLKDVYVEINKQCNNKNYYRKEKATNLYYYKIDTIQEWIDINISQSELSNLNFYEKSDLKNKWLWGIRGIDLNRDIYYYERNNSYRVALKSNIIVGREYQIISKEKPKINGIKFTEIGRLKLSNYRLNEIKSKKVEYKIFIMKIREYNVDSKNYINGKGYRLKESNIKIKHIWPPAKEERKQISSYYNQIYFYSEKNIFDDELTDTIGFIRDGVMTKMRSQNDIVGLSYTNNADLLIDYHRKKRISKEIKYNINKIPNNYTNENYFNIDIENENGEKLYFNNTISSKYFNEKLKVKCQYKISVNVLKDDFVIYTSDKYLEKLNYGNKVEIIVDDIIIYKFKCVDKEKVIDKINVEKEEIKTCFDINYLIRLLSIDSYNKILNSNYITILSYLKESNIDSLYYTFIKNKIMYEGVPIESIGYLNRLWREINENVSAEYKY